MNRRKAIDLFCGAGGTSKGLVDAGFDVPPAYSYYIAKCFLSVSHKSHTLASPTFPTEKAINRNLQVTPSASPKEATLPSVNSDIKRNNNRCLTR